MCQHLLKSGVSLVQQNWVLVYLVHVHVAYDLLFALLLHCKFTNIEASSSSLYNCTSMTPSMIRSMMGLSKISAKICSIPDCQCAT